MKYKYRCNLQRIRLEDEWEITECYDPFSKKWKEAFRNGTIVGELPNYSGEITEEDSKKISDILMSKRKSEKDFLEDELIFLRGIVANYSQNK